MTGTCFGCKKEMPKTNLTYINGQPICIGCKTNLLNEIAAQKATGADIMTGTLGAAAGAIIAGGLWGLMVIFTNYEIGFAAIGVGILAGYGALLGAAKKRGLELQIIASIASITGIAIGKYISFYHYVTKEFEGVSFFSSDTISVFFSTTSEWFSGYDILWVILAVGAAYKIPGMLKLELKGKTATLQKPND